MAAGGLRRCLLGTEEEVRERLLATQLRTSVKQLFFAYEKAFELSTLADDLARDHREMLLKRFLSSDQGIGAISCKNWHTGGLKHDIRTR